VRAAFAERAVELAAEAAREIGVDPAGATVLRVASAVTVDLPRADIIARVERSRELTAAHRQAVAARILEQRRVPAGRLVAPDRQPLVRRDGVVTLWHRLRIVPGRPGPEALGRLARQLHTACADDLPAETPALDPFQPIPGWLSRPADLPLPPGVDALWQRLAELRDSWGETVADDPLGTVLVHGDFHADNVVLTEEGPAMLDLEMAGKGPASWDLMAQQLAVRRYGGPAADYDRFCAAYGAELPSWESVALLRQAYELHLVSWAVGHRDLSPAMAEQATIRLATFLGESDEPWTLI
jgi:hypothetical protein